MAASCERRCSLSSKSEVTIRPSRLEHLLNNECASKSTSYLNASQQTPAKKMELQIPSTNHMVSTELSWASQCTTPIMQTATITSNTTSYTFPAACTSNTTATTSTTSAHLSIMSVSASTTTTETTTSTPNTASSSGMSNNNSNKRQRITPQKSNEKQTTKKHKTKRRILNQTTLSSYWLSKPPATTNRFDALSTDTEDADDTIIHTGTERKNEHTKTQKQFKPIKPPPIFVQNVQYLSILVNALNDLPDCKYELKVLSNNEIKIQPIESIHYSKILELLKDKNTEYYTFKPKDQRGFKVFLRGIHHSVEKDEIKKELHDLGHNVLHVQNVLQTSTKNPYHCSQLSLNKMRITKQSIKSPAYSIV